MFIEFAIDVEFLLIYRELVKFFCLRLRVQVYVLLILSIIGPFSKLFGFLGIFVSADLSIRLKSRFVASCAHINKVFEVDFVGEFFKRFCVWTRRMLNKLTYCCWEGLISRSLDFGHFSLGEFLALETNRNSRVLKVNTYFYLEFFLEVKKSGL